MGMADVRKAYEDSIVANRKWMQGAQGSQQEKAAGWTGDENVARSGRSTLNPVGMGCPDAHSFCLFLMIESTPMRPR
jgi:hypothetical protein